MGLHARILTSPSQTTHLLLAPGGEDTTKHAQAKGRGLTIVTEQWVVDRASADADGDGDDGGDDDDDNDEEEDEEPAGAAAGLEGVVICITGTCASMKRQAMVDLIAAAGGTVSKSVTARVRLPACGPVHALLMRAVW